MPQPALLSPSASGIPLAWSNLSNSPLRIVVVCSPCCEEIRRLIAKGGEIDIMALAQNTYFPDRTHRDVADWKQHQAG